MIIIGEKLNSSIPKTLAALTEKDEKFIIDTIKSQAEGGADYIDINTALTGEDEIKNMKWIIELTKANCSCGIVLDSPDPNVILECLPLCSGRRVIVNSITLSDKYDNLISAIKDFGAGVICLPIIHGKIPEDPQSRFENAAKIIEKLKGVGIADENIYIDVLIEAVATNEAAALTTLKTVAMISNEFKNVNTVCGLSNVSFGLPCRAKLNSTFLAMLMWAGLKAAILDAASETIADTVCIANALLGEDEYCMDYITRFRK